MQKAALVLAPVALLAVVVFFFATKARREQNAGPREEVNVKRTAASESSGGESARLRAEVETLRKQVEAARRRAEEAEARVAKLEGGSSTTAEPKKPAVKKGDWKTRRDAELEAKVKSMAWRKNVKGLMEYWKEIEKSRAEGRSPKMDPDMQLQLTQLTSDATELHKFLGMEGANVWESFGNEVVREAWIDSFLQELSGGTLTEGQLARLRGTKLYDSEDPDLRDGSLFETWKYLIRHNQDYGTETAGVLTPEQLAQVSKAVTPTFMLSVYAAYSERTLAGAAAVTDYWIESFKVPAEQRAAVESVASDFTTRLKDLAQTYTSQYGASLPRDADFEFRLKALDLQIAAEKRLSESLNLDPEQAKKLLKGSGAVIKLAN